jgi:hypothetical protein
MPSALVLFNCGNCRKHIKTGGFFKIESRANFFCFSCIMLILLVRRRFVRRRFVPETFCYRRRFVTGDVLLRSRYVTETFCRETFCRGDVLCGDV